MNAFVSNLMAAWLLILAVTGWCCHPLSHAVACADLCASAANASNCCEDCPQESNQSPKPCQQQDKCQGVCTYLPEKPTEFDSNHALSPYGSLFLACTDVDKYLLTPVRLELACHLSDSAALLRPHHLHRILLI